MRTHRPSDLRHRLAERALVLLPLLGGQALATVPNDHCATPVELPGPGTYPYATVGATTGPQGQNEIACATIQVGTLMPNDVWFTFRATATGPTIVTTCSSTLPSQADTKIAVYAGHGCPVGPVLACNDDALCALGAFLSSRVSFDATCGMEYTIQIAAFTPVDDTFTIEAVGAPCSTPWTSSCAGDGSATTCPCANSGGAGRGCANSVDSAGARLQASGIASATGTDTLTLTADGLSGPALFFQGTGPMNGGSGIAFGDGLLCVSGALTRLGIVFPTGGTASFPGGASASPVHVAGGPIAPGDVRYYQCRYRDGATFCGPAGFNQTQAVSLTWQP